MRQSGSSSFSMRRSTRLYGGCSLTYAGSPSRSATRQRLHHHPRRVRGAPDVAHLAGVDELAERGERLLLRDVGERRAVQLVQVDAVGLQRLERPVARRDDVLTPVPLGRVALAPRHADLGGEHDVVAPAVRGERGADDPLALATGVHVGDVDHVDAAVERRVDHPGRRRGVGRIAEVHGAEAQRRDGEAGGAEGSLLHAR